MSINLLVHTVVASIRVPRLREPSHGWHALRYSEGRGERQRSPIRDRIATVHTSMTSALLIGLTVALLAGGCQQKAGVELAEVTGQVTLSGRPLRADVLFQPEADDHQPRGRPSTALAGEDGRFQLTYSPEKTGALLGWHQVTVRVLPYADRGEPGSMQEASGPIKTGRFRRQVERGKNAFDFAMTP